MKENFLYILVILYATGGFMNFIGFLPTIFDLWKKHPSANISTYAMWTTTTALASLYGFFVIQDLLFNIIVNLQLAACIVVLLLRLRIKKSTANELVHSSS